jgi:hypothetical protein
MMLFFIMFMPMNYNTSKLRWCFTCSFFIHFMMLIIIAVVCTHLNITLLRFMSCHNFTINYISLIIDHFFISLYLHLHVPILISKLIKLYHWLLISAFHTFYKALHQRSFSLYFTSHQVRVHWMHSLLI